MIPVIIVMVSVMIGVYGPKHSHATVVGLGCARYKEAANVRSRRGSGMDDHKDVIVLSRRRKVSRSSAGQ